MLDVPDTIDSSAVVLEDKPVSDENTDPGPENPTAADPSVPEGDKDDKQGSGPDPADLKDEKAGDQPREKDGKFKNKKNSGQLSLE
jgi:hypothetical protein